MVMRRWGGIERESSIEIFFFCRPWKSFFSAREGCFLEAAREEYANMCTWDIGPGLLEYFILRL